MRPFLNYKSMSERSDQLRDLLETVQAKNKKAISQAEKRAREASPDYAALERAAVERIQAFCAALEQQILSEIDECYVVVSPEALLVSELLSTKRRRKSA